MLHRKRAVDAKKLRNYVMILLLALLVVSLLGCVEEGDEGSSVVEDLGEPIDKTIGYVGKDGFGIPDVDEKLTGEGSLYALVVNETEAQSSGTDLKQYAKFAELTCLDENGNKIMKYQINDEFVDLSGDEIKQLKAHSLQEDQIMPLIEDLGGGKYDCPMLKESTLRGGYVYDFSIFPYGKTK
jgi:hypothetical protein